MRKALVLLCLSGMITGSGFADPSDLEGGVFIAHLPASIEFSSEPPTSGWCQEYWDTCRIATCADQVNRIDTTDQVIWFVLAAWREEKNWCGTEFGFAEYDPAAFVITDFGPCWPREGLELPTATWPGPGQGTAIVTTGDNWQGNFVPVYFFAGYAYEQEVISLAANPATGFAGSANCSVPVRSWPADSLGAMGLFRDGRSACPSGVMIGGQGSEPQGGGGILHDPISLTIRFEPGVVGFPLDTPDMRQHFQAPAADAVIALPGLDSLLADIGVVSFSTIAPGWRHLTPERSVDFFGDPIDLVDFTDVYLVTFNGLTPIDDVIETLAGEPGIVYVERPGEFTLYDLPDEPNDPYYADSCCGQWYLNNDENNECEDCVPDVDMNVPEAWVICYDQDPPIKAGTKIGIMEGPLLEDHEDMPVDFALSGSFYLTGEWNNDPATWGAPNTDHATAMAGLAGAATDNSRGVASIANVPLSHEDSLIVALTINRLGGGGIPPQHAAANALCWICTEPLARGRIRVVNASYGTPRYKFCHDLADTSCAGGGLLTLRDAARNAFRTGVNLVCSAGNGGTPVGPCGTECGDPDTSFAYPAAFPDYALGISAIGCAAQVSDPSFNVGSYVDLAGPGVGVEALGMVCSPGFWGGSYLQSGQGTSPASPVIASAVALLLGAQGNLYPEDCGELLKASANAYGHPRIVVGAGMPRLDSALGWITGDHRVFHGSSSSYTYQLEAGWDPSDPHRVMLKNVPETLCADGTGEEWQELYVLAYRVTTVVQIDPPANGSIERAWPRGAGSTGWRLLDQTLEGDPSAPPYYDVNYYENWARLIDVSQSAYTFTSYTYRVVREGEDCWVPFDPSTGPYNLNYSYVAYDPNMMSAVDQAGASPIGLTIRNVPARSNFEFSISLPDRALVWLGAYDVNGRLLRSILDARCLEAGATVLAWNGGDDHLLEAGIYFMRMQAQLEGGGGRLTTLARLVIVR